jgi:hypothetical protein
VDAGVSIDGVLELREVSPRPIGDGVRVREDGENDGVWMAGGLGPGNTAGTDGGRPNIAEAEEQLPNAIQSESKQRHSVPSPRKSQWPYAEAGEASISLSQDARPDLEPFPSLDSNYGGDNAPSNASVRSVRDSHVSGDTVGTMQTASTVEIGNAVPVRITRHKLGSGDEV